MEIGRVTPPYIAHNAADLNLPSVPQTEISHAYAQAEITLPDLRTVLSPAFHADSLPSHFRPPHIRPTSPTSIRSLPRIDPGPTYPNDTSRNSEAVMMSPSESGSVMSSDERSLRPTSVSMDDPDVRIAAEALSGLGNPDFVRSPPTGSLSHASPSSARSTQPDPEPLLELFTKAHPWVGGTINTSLTAYSTTKNYSPRFVQYGANLVERNITTPVVSTVSTIGRVTGVESGLRWYYGANSTTPNDVDGDDEGTASKRRRLMNDEMDIESDHGSAASRFRRDSQESAAESLPAYRASKPPSYREEDSPAGNDRRMQLGRPLHNRSWSSSVFVSTSGLGVALSATSRRSLRYCLTFLGRQADHVTTVMNALKLVLEQYDQARDAWHQNNNSALEKGQRARTPENDEAARRLAQIIKTHSEDIWRTLETVVTSVSNYAGGALPENARHFVRNQLMSLPQRWRVVSETQTGESETSRSAHRMIAFATEGLDMMSQVSQTMKLTLESAEKWLERAGRGEAVDSPNNYDGKSYSTESRDVEFTYDIEKQ